MVNHKTAVLLAPSAGRTGISTLQSKRRFHQWLPTGEQVRLLGSAPYRRKTAFRQWQ
jgi:hypothetical protein